MPLFDNRMTFRIARNLRAFFNLQVGLTRGETPQERSERTLEKQLAALRGSTSHRNGPSEGVRPENIVWILGGGRTGSSWLGKMMEEAFGTPLWFEPRIGDLFDPEWMASQGGRGYVFGPEHEEKWLPAIRSFILSNADARFPDAKSLVIKETSGSKATSLLFRAVPESKAVLLVRDPRDVVASWQDAYSEGGWRDRQVRRRGHGGNQNPLKRLGADEHARRRAENYSASMTAAIEGCKAHGAGKVVTVKYEELRADGEEAMLRVARTLRLPTESIPSTVASNSFDAISEKKKGPGKFYRKATPGSWREDLTAEQVRIVEETCAPIIEEFYPETPAEDE